jgi:hypothetical protein
MNEHSTVDNFDRQLGQFDGLPDAVQTRPATVRATSLVQSETFIIQTVRHGSGDIVFIEHVAGGTATRLVLPPNVTEVIARQRDAVAYLTKRKQGQRLAASSTHTQRRNPLLDPKVRAKALAARKAKAAKRRARREARSSK